MDVPAFLRGEHKYGRDDPPAVVSRTACDRNPVCRRVLSSLASAARLKPDVTL